jgi:hypothetical protein
MVLKVVMFDFQPGVEYGIRINGETYGYMLNPNIPKSIKSDIHGNIYYHMLATNPNREIPRNIVLLETPIGLFYGGTEVSCDL